MASCIFELRSARAEYEALWAAHEAEAEPEGRGLVAAKSILLLRPAREAIEAAAARAKFEATQRRKRQGGSSGGGGSSRAAASLPRGAGATFSSSGAAAGRKVPGRGR